MSNAITIALFIFHSAETHMAKARMLSWGWYDVVHLWSPTSSLEGSIYLFIKWTCGSYSYSTSKWGKLGQLSFSPKCPNLFPKRRAGTCIADVGMMWHLFCGHMIYMLHNLFMNDDVRATATDSKPKCANLISNLRRSLVLDQTPDTNILSRPTCEYSWSDEMYRARW